MSNSRVLAKFILATTIILCSELWSSTANGIQTGKVDVNHKIITYCTVSDECSTTNTSSKNTLTTLLNSLAQIGPSNEGFYNTTVGNDSSKLYGLIQCRGDLPPAVCTSCARNATKLALAECNGTNCKELIFKWCTLRTSTKNFFGSMEEYGATLVNSSSSESDDPDVASSGLQFMQELASSAPERNLMFQYAVLDMGASGVRYGMAQCNGDLNRSTCSYCLNHMMEIYNTRIADKKGWEIYSSGCNLWYHDYPFFFNVSRPDTSIGFSRTGISGKTASWLITVGLALLFVL